jgi:hypothetical protein
MLSDVLGVFRIELEMDGRVCRRFHSSVPLTIMTYRSTIVLFCVAYSYSLKVDLTDGTDF